MSESDDDFLSGFTIVDEVEGDDDDDENEAPVFLEEDGEPDSKKIKLDTDSESSSKVCNDEGKAKLESSDTVNESEHFQKSSDLNNEEEDPASLCEENCLAISPCATKIDDRSVDLNVDECIVPDVPQDDDGDEEVMIVYEGESKVNHTDSSGVSIEETKPADGDHKSFEEENIPTETRANEMTCNKEYDLSVKRKAKVFKDEVKVIVHDIFDQSIRKYMYDKHSYTVKILDFQRAPVFTEYRNKCTFAVEYDEEKKTPVVRYCQCTIREGNNLCDRCIRELPETIKQSAKLFEEYTQQLTLGKDFWHTLTIRSSCYGEVMIVVQVKASPEAENIIDDVKTDMKAYFEEKNQQQRLKVASLYIARSVNGYLERTHLLGKKSIEENVLGRRYLVSAFSNFESCTATAEILYRVIENLIKPDSSTLVLDLGCCSGILSVKLASVCKEVLGFDFDQASVEDAVANAANSNNCEFFRGVNIRSKLKNKVYRELVAIVRLPFFINLNELRRLAKLEKIVYIADNVQVMKDVAKRLSNEKPNSQDYPFLPTKVVPIDMYPLSRNCHVVMYFERTRKPKSPPIKIKSNVSQDHPVTRNTFGNTNSAAGKTTENKQMGNFTQQPSRLSNVEDRVTDQVLNIFDKETVKGKNAITNRFHQLYYKVNKVDWKQIFLDEFNIVADAVYARAVNEFPEMGKLKGTHEETVGSVCPRTVQRSGARTECESQYSPGSSGHYKGFETNCHSIPQLVSSFSSSENARFRTRGKKRVPWWKKSKY